MYTIWASAVRKLQRRPIAMPACLPAFVHVFLRRYSRQDIVEACCLGELKYGLMCIHERFAIAAGAGRAGNSVQQDQEG